MTERESTGVSAGVGGCETVSGWPKTQFLATTEIKDEDDYYFISETSRPLLRLQLHPPMPSSESESEDIESDASSIVYSDNDESTTTEDTENYNTEVPLRWNDDL